MADLTNALKLLDKIDKKFSHLTLNYHSIRLYSDGTGVILTPEDEELISFASIRMLERYLTNILASEEGADIVEICRMTDEQISDEIAAGELTPEGL